MIFILGENNFFIDKRIENGPQRGGASHDELGHFSLNQESHSSWDNDDDVCKAFFPPISKKLTYNNNFGGTARTT